MEDKLQEIEDKENQVNYENFDTDEPQQQSHKKKKIKCFPIISILASILFIVFIIFYLNIGKSHELSRQSQCLTTSSDKKECKTCNPGDKLENGKCVINYSFKAVYRTKSPNEKVTLFNIPQEIVLEMYINNEKVEPSQSLVFPESGDHTLHALIDMNKCYTLGGMFNGNKHLISIEFSPLFNTERINEMNFMFQNCKSLTSVDVSNLNTKNVAFMEYMFAGCTSLKTLEIGRASCRERVYVLV